MSIDINIPVLIFNWNQCRYKLISKCFAILFVILLLTYLIINYWTSPSNIGSKHLLQQESFQKINELKEKNAVLFQTSITSTMNKEFTSTMNYQQKSTVSETLSLEKFEETAPKQKVYYFDGPIQKASVTLDNSWAAYFYYRLNTHSEDWKCQKLHRIESRPGNFDFIFFCEDLSPELDCMMYSFGINYWWGNEEQFRDKYDCNIFSFDPSMTKMGDGYIKNVKPRIDFMRLGLSNIDTNIPDPIHRDTSAAFGGAVGKNRAWTMVRFSTLIKMLNQTDKLIDMVAIDSEGAEYGFLEDIVETGVWRNIKQLCIEYHFFPGTDRFFIRHARALNQFRRLGQFLQVTHELVHVNAWDQNAGNEFRGKHASYITVHYINKMYINRTVPTRNPTIRQTTTFLRTTKL